MRTPHIGVFRALKIGDMVCLIPALRAIRTHYPRARITLIGLSWANELTARLHGLADDIIRFPGMPGLPESDASEEDYDRFMYGLRSMHFDIYLQLHGNGTLVNRHLRAVNADVIAGFRTAGAGKGLPDTFIPYPERKHEIDKMLSVTSLLGIKSAGTYTELQTLQTDTKRALRLARGAGLDGAYAVIHPGSISSTPVSLEWYTAAARELHRQGCRIAVTGLENEKPLGIRLQNMIEFPLYNLCGKTDFGMLCALIQGSKILVSGDTGTYHLAMALKTKTLTLYGSDRFEEWKPKNPLGHATLDIRENPPTESVSRSIRQLSSLKHL